MSQDLESGLDKTSEDRQTFSIFSLFTGLSLATKLLSLTVFTLTLSCKLFPSLFDYLALIPGYTYPPHFFVWNIITSGYFHISLIEGLLSALILLSVGKYLEPIWGSKELIRFTFVINLTVNFVIFATLIGGYFATGKSNYLFPSVVSDTTKGPDISKPVYGFASFSASMTGFSVAFKQLQPESELPVIGSLGLRYKHVPLILVLSHFVLLGLQIRIIEACYVILGWYASWLYLRRFQRQGDNIVGDLSEDFEFASFFPDLLRPFISRSSRLLCFCFAGKNSWQKPDGPGRGPQSITRSDTKQSERRKIKGFKALHDKLSESNHHPVADIVGTELGDLKENDGIAK